MKNPTHLDKWGANKIYILITRQEKVQAYESKWKDKENEIGN